MSWIERGGPVMWPLLLLSVSAVAVLFERWLFWRRERRRPWSAEPLDLELEQRRLERGMPFLDTVVTSAPLMGILGTVLGIIDALALLGERASPDPVAVSGGVARALVTTATGLVIALCVLFPYNWLRVRVRDRLADLERAAGAQPS